MARPEWSLAKMSWSGQQDPIGGSLVLNELAQQEPIGGLVLNELAQQEPIGGLVLNELAQQEPIGGLVWNELEWAWPDLSGLELK